MSRDHPNTGAAATVGGMTPLPVKLRLHVMMFVQYFVQGCYLPIISVYLQDALGFDSLQLGYMGAALAVGPLVSPWILGQLVDRHLATQKVLAFCHLFSGAMMIILYTQTSVGLVILLGTIYSVLYVPSLMLTNSLTFHHLANRDREFPLVRLWGTIGFVVPAWIIELWWLQGLEGQELNEGRGVALLFSGIAGIVMGLYSLTLPNTPPTGSKSKDFAPAKVIRMLRYRHVLVLVLVTFGVAIVHKFFFIWNSPYLSALLLRGGITEPWEQRISSIGQISEVAVMAGLGLAILKIGFKRTMVIGIVAYLGRCVILSGAAVVDGPVGLVLTIACIGQAMHGFCFGCFLAAGYMYVDRVAPVDIRGSMQNIYGTFVITLGFFVGGFIAGAVGGWCTTNAGEETLRQKMGIATTAGLIEFSGPGDSSTLVRDWPGIWMASAVVAVVCLVFFVMLFPSSGNGNGRSDQDTA